MTATKLEDTKPLTFKLRAASTADQPTITQMVKGAHLNPMGLNWQRFTLAETPDGRIIGCVQHKHHRGDVIELASLVVVKEWRRKGVARRLIDHIKETAGSPLWLMCVSQLTGFYQQFGFRRVTLKEPMPTYFRWILRMFFLIDRFSPPHQTLAIMVWEKD
ncbi:MAG: GNAT family N-acetyltransferase [Candidatus Promineifilaceae bacterium]